MCQLILTTFIFEKHFATSSLRKKIIKITRFIQWLNGTCFVYFNATLIDSAQLH